MKSRILDLFEVGEKAGINYIQIDKCITGTAQVLINNEEFINFGNCSYLGIDHLPTVRDKIKEIITEHGAQYSSSRAFSSLRYLSETEDKISQLFNRESIVYTTTGIGHISAIPNLVTRRDLVIYDRQVHKTVQNAIQMVKGQGIETMVLSHNAKDELDEILAKNAAKYAKIYLMIDSIYSMYGDRAPLKYYYNLLNKYDSFHLYVDDAHGMSWIGEHGTGLTLSQIGWHEKLIMATSFSKGFGANGAAILFPKSAMKNQIKYLGSGTVFSGQVYPPSLAAIDASADIHLSNEVEKYQNILLKNITYFHELCTSYRLSVKSESLSPINYIELGSTENTVRVVTNLMRSGVLVNACDFPAVPKNKSGIRISITALHNNIEIEQLVMLVKAYLI